MPATSTYSFLDLSGAVAHPALGAYTFTGEGVGEVVISSATEKSSHDVAADGSILVSKIAGNNGSISISVQQNSPVDTWLLAAYNYLINANADEWAQMAATLRSASFNRTHILTGMSFQKKPDRSYQAQGQRVNWVLMVADIQDLPF